MRMEKSRKKVRECGRPLFLLICCHPSEILYIDENLFIESQTVFCSFVSRDGFVGVYATIQLIALIFVHIAHSQRIDEKKWHIGNNNINIPLLFKIQIDRFASGMVFFSTAKWLFNFSSVLLYSVKCHFFFVCEIFYGCQACKLTGLATSKQIPFRSINIFNRHNHNPISSRCTFSFACLPETCFTNRFTCEIPLLLFIFE